jgi:hypothetical protein
MKRVTYRRVRERCFVGTESESEQTGRVGMMALPFTNMKPATHR